LITTIKEAVYLHFKTKNYSKEDQALIRFFDKWILPIVGDMKIEEATKEFFKSLARQVDDYHFNVKRKRLSGRSLQNVARILRPALRDYTGLVSYIHRPKTKIQPQQDFSHKLKATYEAISSLGDPYWKALFFFAFFGRRKSEIENLEWRDIDFDRPSYTIRNTKNGDKEQTYYLPDEISALLKDRDNSSIYVFNNHTNYKYYKHNKDIALLSGVNITAHKYRSLLASNVIAHGGNQQTAMASLGHSVETLFAGMLKHYATVDRWKESKKAYELIKSQVTALPYYDF